MVASAFVYRGMGASFGKVFERCRLVLLSVLASQVPLRCARVRCKTRRLLRLDSLRRLWSRMPRGRLVFQLVAAPKSLSHVCAKDGARAQRGGYAGGPADLASACRAGHRD